MLTNPYEPITVQHTYAAAGAYRAIVTVSNGEGSSSVKQIDLVVQAPPNTAPTATLTVTPTNLVAGQSVSASIGGSDPEDDQLTYSLDFGDGSVPVTGSLPQTGLNHVYARAGTFVVRLVVSDGRLSGVQVSTVVVALAEPVAANAGDDQTVVVGTPVHFDGSNSRPTAGIESYHWSLGDGSVAERAQADHAYAKPGTYEATLTVTAAGSTSVDTVTITVVPVPVEPGLRVTVLDAGVPLGGASVVVVTASGTRFSATSGADGIAQVDGLPDGDYTVYAWGSGYVANSVAARIESGGGTATITLTQGQIATTSLTSTPLTYEEIVAAGIDPTAPENQHVYEFEIHLAFEPLRDYVISGYTAGGGGGGGGGGWFPQISLPGGRTCGSDPVCVFALDSGASVAVTSRWVNDQPQLFWMVIPGEAKWLKEFFSVQLMVTNLAGPGISLENGSATLQLPDGLSLAPTGEPQHLTTSVPSVPGGESRSVEWLVRGDQEGDYNLQASYAATLEPFGTTLNVEAHTDKPLHVWGSSALSLNAQVEETAMTGYPYHVQLSLTNVADVPVYNVRLAALEDNAEGFIYQPQQQLATETAVLAPGETLVRDLVLVPISSGHLNLEKSFVVVSAGGNLSPTITSVPVATPFDQVPTLRAIPLDQKVGLIWDAVPGASYELYDTSAPDVPFGARLAVGLLQDVGDGKVRAIVDAPEYTTRYYAVRTITHGGGEMVHPLVAGASGDASTGPDIFVDFDTKSGSSKACLLDDEISRAVGYQVDSRDPFGIASYTVKTSTGLELSGTTPTRTPSALSLANFEPLTVTRTSSPTVTVVVVGLSGQQTEVTATLDASCPVEKAVVVATGLFTSLNSTLSPSTVSVTDPDCPDDPSVRDGFSNGAATNACDNSNSDPVTDPTGNLVAYLQSLGYNPGETRESGGRTLLEYSYTGSQVSCRGVSGPTFIPNDYTDIRTVVETIGSPTLLPVTASQYYEALKEYRDCWKQVNGRTLEFTVIGHSLGGYQALNLGLLAGMDPNADGIIQDVVTVDGAVNPEAVMTDLNMISCFGFNLASVAGETALSSWKVTHPVATAATYVGEHAVGEIRKDQVQLLRDGGIGVHTLTNLKDGCLSVDATTVDTAETALWSIETGEGGMADHSAPTKAHIWPVTDAGFPLREYLDNQVFGEGTAVSWATIPAMSTRSTVPLLTTRSVVSFLTTTLVEERSSVVGRVVSTSGDPLPGGQVSLVDVSSAFTARVGSDGSFAITDVPAGEYKLRVVPVADGYTSRWWGGPTQQTARTVTVTGDASLGDVPAGVNGIVRATIRNSDGSPATDAGAILRTPEGSTIAHATVDAAGVATFEAPPGEYVVNAASLTTKPASAPVTLDDSTSTEITLVPAARVTATANSSTGEPLLGIMVAVYDGDTLVAAGLTDTTGSVTILGLEDGKSYSVRMGDIRVPTQEPTIATAVASATGGAESIVNFGSASPNDTVAPVVTGGVLPAANAAGWHREDVTVTWLATDPEPSSGLSDTPQPTVWTTEGTSMTVSSPQVCDVAGNCTTGKVALSLDLTLPTIMATVSDPDPATGVRTVHFECADALSGIAGCTPDVQVDSASSSNPVMGEAVDVAGNTAAMSLTVDGPLLTSSAPHMGVVGTPYAFTFTAIGTPAPTFRVQAGELPTGLAMDAAGFLTGTPSQAGDFPVTIAAVSEGDVATAEYMIRIAAAPPSGDDPPVAVDDAVTIAEDSPAAAVDVLANDTDVDGGLMMITAVSHPVQGTAEVAADAFSVLYRPDADYCNVGDPVVTDDFEYTLNGGSIGTVRVTVTCVDDAPVAVDDSVTVAEDSPAAPVDVLANDTDVDGGLMMITGVSDPVQGTAEVAPDGASVSYRPDADYCSAGDPVVTDDFTYTLAPDGSVGTVRVTVNCVDDAPIIATKAELTVQYSDAPQSATVVATDPDSDAAALSLEGLPSGITAAKDCAAVDGGATCSWTLGGTASDQPGEYAVTVTDGISSSEAGTLTINPEDAGSAATGALETGFVQTASAKTTSVTIPLQATIRDITVLDPGSDANPGDIRTAKVTFLVNGSAPTNCTDLPVNLVEAGDPGTGTAGCDWEVRNISTSGANFDITLIVSGHYVTQPNLYSLEVALGGGTGYISGGGWLAMTDSAGTYAATTDTRMNFGFNVKYNKSQKNLQGHVNIIYRRDGYVYQVKSNAINSLTTRLGEPATGTFFSKANLVDVTDPLNPVTVDGNYTLLMTVTDNGEPGSSDMIGVTLTKAGALVFSSNWSGDRTTEEALTAGNLVVR